MDALHYKECWVTGDGSVKVRDRFKQMYWCKRADFVENNWEDTLSPGTHAFVRMPYEPFLRVGCAAFPFGKARDHVSLAGCAQVISAGMLEIDNNGVLMRWTNKNNSFRVNGPHITCTGLPLDKLLVYRPAIEGVRREKFQAPVCLKHRPPRSRAEQECKVNINGLPPWPTDQDPFRPKKSTGGNRRSISC